MPRYVAGKVIFASKQAIMHTSPHVLRFLAAVVWLGGSVALTLKGSSLLMDADIHRPGHPWTWYAGITGIAAGIIKGIFLFYRAGKKNLRRIFTLKRPRIWQFYRPKFFLFMFSMILLGKLLSFLAEGNFGFLLFVAALDLSIATALLVSFVVFFRQYSVDSTR